MKIVGKHLTYSGKRLGNKLIGNGKSLGKQMPSHKHHRGMYLEEEQEDYREAKSDLERGHSKKLGGNIHHHIPRDGQATMIHGSDKHTRQPWQRKKNH